MSSKGRLAALAMLRRDRFGGRRLGTARRTQAFIMRPARRRPAKMSGPRREGNNATYN